MLTAELRKKIGSFFMVSFDSLVPSKDLLQFIREKEIGGALLFRQNAPSVGVIRENIALLKEASTHLSVAIDHEGGRVHRLPKPVTHFPPMRAVGKLCEKMPQSKIPYEVGRAMGRELKSLGFDINFAPVMDVNTNPNNPVIGDRAFANDPKIVAYAGSQMIQGLQEAHVAACAKHFPGHGDTDFDSHEVLPKLNHNERRLQSVELPPFQAALEAGVASIMTAHVVYDGIDKNTIATLSIKIIRDILREGMGFHGVVFSDDLSMGAIAKNFPMEEGCVLAFLAGCDWLIIGKDLEKQKKAVDYFTKAVEKGRIPLTRVEESHQRIHAFKNKYSPLHQERPSSKVIGSKEHKDLHHQLQAFV